MLAASALVSAMRLWQSLVQIVAAETVIVRNV